MKSLIALICGFGVVGSIHAGASVSGGAAALANEWNKLEVEIALAPVRSADDLVTYMASHKEGSALDRLQPMRRELFLQSLVFNEHGLAGFSREALDGLTPPQIYQVLSIFGVQSLLLPEQARRAEGTGTTLILAEPLKGFRCGGGHTCIEDSNAACTSNC